MVLTMEPDLLQLISKPQRKWIANNLAMGIIVSKTAD